MKQKMWIRKEGDLWGVGCQVCGRLVTETDCFLCALPLAWRHIYAHREINDVG